MFTRALSAVILTTIKALADRPCHAELSLLPHLASRDDGESNAKWHGFGQLAFLALFFGG
jgi:hypothetical protein